MPYTFTVLIVLAGLVFIWFNRKKLGSILISFALLLLWFFGSNFGSVLIMTPLESAYEPLMQDNQFERLERAESPLIVVMGSGHYTSPTFPVTSQLDASALFRLTEGLRIYHRLPDSKLILMGGSLHDDSHTSDLKIQLLTEMGLSVDQIETHTGAYDTEQEAVLIRNLMEKQPDSPLIIVTSARHMPRTIGLIQKQGLNPIAAPTRHFILGPPKGYLGYLTWTPVNLDRSHKAIHEYTGILWSKIRGKY